MGKSKEVNNTIPQKEGIVLVVQDSLQSVWIKAPDAWNSLSPFLVSKILRLVRSCMIQIIVCLLRIDNNRHSHTQPEARDHAHWRPWSPLGSHTMLNKGAEEMHLAKWQGLTNTFLNKRLHFSIKYGYMLGPHLLCSKRGLKISGWKTLFFGGRSITLEHLYLHWS